MANIFESAFMTLKNGMTMYFADSKARQLVDKLKALVDTKYGPDNPPPSTEGSRIWYATCSTAAGTGAKTATSSTGDFVLQTGAMVRLKCTTANTAANPTISIDGSTAKTIQPKSGTSGMAYRWRAQEVIDLVYDGSTFIMSLGPEADTSFYGITKLSSATNSTAENVAATPKAVKDAYDLAAAAYSSSNPPPYPVTSVNGQTGDVVLPYSNTNLLDNWYFVGGGSQRGVGALPINSKGQTSYSSLSGTSCIDGWSGYNNLDVTLVTGGTLISGSATSPFPALIQFTKLTSEEIRGRTLTLTVFLGTGIVTATGDIPNSPATYTNYLYTADATQHCIIQFYLNSSGRWAAQISSNQASGITLYAAKLEIGSTQSLAHYENGAWVLNEMPLYAVELLKCSNSGNTTFVDNSYYRKMGNLCVLTFRSSSTITTGATNEWKSIGTLPVGYRPNDRTYGVLGAGSFNSTYYATVKVEATGDVSVCCAQAANVTYLAGTVTFFTSQ